VVSIQGPKSRPYLATPSNMPRSEALEVSTNKMTLRVPGTYIVYTSLLPAAMHTVRNEYPFWQGAKRMGSLYLAMLAVAGCRLAVAGSRRLAPGPWLPVKG
jgi:hypothetical protein